MKTLKTDLAFETHNYFSKNNLNNNDLSKLTLIDIHDQAKKLESELNNYKREDRFRGGVSVVRKEMVDFINHALGIK